MSQPDNARPRVTAAMQLARIHAPIIHSPDLVDEALRLLLASGQRGRFACPPELGIVTCKNYAALSPLERSLDFIGPCNLHVIQRDPREAWVNILRTRWLIEYIDSGRCQTPYLLVSDASDVVVRGSLQRVLDVFRTRNCRVLFMSTRYDGGYACMPDRKEWVGQRRYLNAGVYVGETSYIREVLQRMLAFVVDRPLSKARFRELGRGRGQDRRLCESLPAFPHGIGSDQIVLRYLEPSLWPDLQVDCENEIAFRNAGMPPP